MKTVKYGSKHFLFVMIPLIVAIYIAMIMCQNFILKSSNEIFPFFNWSLFSAPSKRMVKSYVKIESMDGEIVNSKEGLLSIGMLGGRLDKSISEALSICRTTKFENCENEVIELLSPFINKWNRNYKKLEFSIFRCHIDPQKVVMLMKQGIERFPKIMDCKSTEIYGPWSIFK